MAVFLDRNIKDRYFSPRSLVLLVNIVAILFIACESALESYNRGVEYENIGEYKKASEQYTKAIKIDPDFFQAYKNRGVVYLNLGQFELAIKDYDEFIKLVPEDAGAYWNRGVAFKGLGNDIEAERNFKKSIELGYRP